MLDEIEQIRINLLKDSKHICPIIVSSDGKIIDGNKRVLAAREAGLTTLPGVIIQADIVEINIDDLQITWNPRGEDA